MQRLLARLVRWSLPVALLTATIVAASGLVGTLLPGPVQPPEAPPAALNLTSAPALPAADDDAPVLKPQGLDRQPDRPSHKTTLPCPQPRTVCPDPGRDDCCR